MICVFFYFYFYEKLRSLDVSEKLPNFLSFFENVNLHTVSHAAVLFMEYRYRRHAVTFAVSNTKYIRF